MSPILRRAAKQVVEVVLEGSGISALARRRMGGRDLVLAYHGVVEDGAVHADASAHLAVSSFAAQMEAIAELAEVVPVGALFAPPRRRDRPRVAITFDDGYRGALRHAVPILTALGLPATFFVCPSLLGGEHFWWDCRSLDVWQRKPELLDRLEGRAERVWPRLREEGFGTEALGDDFRPASIEEVRAAAAAPGITVGSHTMRHPNLAVLGMDAVRAELGEAHRWLSAQVPSYLPWIAYPFGLATPEVERVAEELGYAGGFVLDGGWIPATGARRYGLPRLNIAAGLSTRGFRIRLADIFAR